MVYKTIRLDLLIFTQFHSSSHSFSHHKSHRHHNKDIFLPNFADVVVDNKIINRKIFLLLTSNSRADVAVGRLWSFSVCFSTHDSSTTMLVWRFFINPIACSTLRSLTMINSSSVKGKRWRIEYFCLTFLLIEHKCCSIECWGVQRSHGDVSGRWEPSSELPCDLIDQPGHSSYPFEAVAA